MKNINSQSSSRDFSTQPVLVSTESLFESITASLKILFIVDVTSKTN